MTQQTDYQRARSALLKHAEQPMPALLAALDSSRRDLLAALAGITDDQARFRPRTGGAAADAEEAWSIAEVLRHLVQAEEGIADRVARLARGEPAETSVPGALGGHADTPLPGLIEALAASREKLRSVVESISGNERLDTTVAHAFFGELNCRGWLALWVRHEASHVRQIEQIKASEGYPK